VSDPLRQSWSHTLTTDSIPRFHFKRKSCKVGAAGLYLPDPQSFAARQERGQGDTRHRTSSSFATHPTPTQPDPSEVGALPSEFAAAMANFAYLTTNSCGASRAGSAKAQTPSWTRLLRRRELKKWEDRGGKRKAESYSSGHLVGRRALRYRYEVPHTSRGTRMHHW